MAQILEKLWAGLRASLVLQAGVILVALGGLAELLDQLGSVDLASVPYVGKYAPASLAIAGVLKIILRFIVLIGGALTAGAAQAPAAPVAPSAPVVPSVPSGASVPSVTPTSTETP